MEDTAWAATANKSRPSISSSCRSSLKELPITEEFTLRYVALGINSPEDFAEYPGLDSAHVLEAAAAQLSENHLTRSGGRLALTPSGVEVVRTLVATQPVLRQLPVAFDRLAWRLVDYSESFLIEKKDAQDRGMAILPAARNAQIGPDDVTPAGFNDLLKGGKLQILRVHKVTSRKHRYLPVKLLVYADQSRRESELAICIEDDLATDHGLALDRIQAVERLGLSLGDAEPRPVLDEELEGQRRTDSPAEADAAEGQGDHPPADSGLTAPAVPGADRGTTTFISKR